MQQDLDGLTKKTNRLLQVLSEEREQLPPQVVWAGLEFAANINAWALELHHESTSHLHRQKAEFCRSIEPPVPKRSPPVAAAEW